MTSAIFYFRHSNRRGVRGLHSIWQDGQHVGYVRVELFDGDVDAAMASARLKPGESLMNTHEIAPKKKGKKRSRWTRRSGALMEQWRDGKHDELMPSPEERAQR